MKVVMTNCSSYGNGRDGLRVQGNVDLTLNSFTAFDNGGQGINLIATYPEALGLPKDFDAKALAELLEQLQGVAPERRADVAERSGLLRTLGGGALDATGLIANVVTIAGSPQVQAVIARLIQP